MQEGTVSEYREEFERLSVYLPPLQDIVMEHLVGLHARMDAALHAEKCLKPLWEAYNIS